MIIHKRFENVLKQFKIVNVAKYKLTSVIILNVS